MAYIFQADLYCDSCGRQIAEQLRLEGKAPEDESEECTYDSDDFPKYAGDEGGGETDCPQHCGGCHEYLGAPLTSHGVQYVIDSIRESIQEAIDNGRASTWDRIMPAAGTGEDTEGFCKTWGGKRHVEIVRTWAEDIQNYGLEQEESAIVNLFLELSEPNK